MVDMVYRKKNYISGQLDNIEFVVVLTKNQNKWVFCWHKRRESFENIKDFTIAKNMLKAWERDYGSDNNGYICIFSKVGGL